MQYDVAVLNSLQVVKQLEGQHLDLGFIEQPLTLKGAVRTTLCTDQLIAAGWSTGTWITREEGSGMRYYTTAYLQAAGISPQHMMTVNNNAMLLALVQQGVGQALLSDQVALGNAPAQSNWAAISTAFLLAAKPNHQLAPQTGHAR